MKGSQKEHAYKSAETAQRIGQSCLTHGETHTAIQDDLSLYHDELALHLPLVRVARSNSSRLHTYDAGVAMLCCVFSDERLLSILRAPGKRSGPPSHFLLRSDPPAASPIVSFLFFPVPKAFSPTTNNAISCYSSMYQKGFAHAFFVVISRTQYSALLSAWLPTDDFYCDLFTRE